MKKTKILRKLDAKETGIITLGYDQNMILRVKFASKLDLFTDTNRETFKKAILAWKRWQKFLSSRIRPTNNSEYYFEYVDDNDDSYRFENVKFLRLDSQQNPSVRDYEQVSDLIFEYCNLNEIDPDKNPDHLLWYLYVLELEKRVDGWSYEIFINFHHSIVQGVASFRCICYLLRIFEKLNKRETVQFEQEVVFPGCESLFAFAKDYISPTVHPVLKRPSFIDPARAKSHSLKQTCPSFLDPNGRLVDVETNELFKTIGNLTEMSRQSHIKFKVVRIDKDQFEQLLTKCNQEGATLTGCLQVIISLILREMFDKYGEPNELEFIRTVTYLNLRPFVKDQNITENTLGLCVGTFIKYPDIDELGEMTGRRQQLVRKFWPTAREHTRDLHQKYQSDMEKYFPKLNTNTPTDLSFHVTISNTGKVQPSNVNVFSCFKIERQFASSNFLPSCDKRLFANYFNKSERGLVWFLLYNSHFIDSYLIQFVVDSFKSILEVILSASVKSNL